MNFFNIVFVLMVGMSLTLSSAAEANQPPQISSVEFLNPYIHQGVDIEVSPEAEDSDGDLIYFRYRWFINGRELDHDSPVLERDMYVKGDRIALWVVPSDNTEEGPIFYGAEFVVQNAPPEFTSTPALEFMATQYNYQPQVYDPDDESFTFLLEQAPEGMSIDQDSGLITWNIDAEAMGTHTIKILAQDASGATAIQEYTLTLTMDEK